MEAVTLSSGGPKQMPSNDLCCVMSVALCTYHGAHLGLLPSVHGGFTAFGNTHSLEAYIAGMG